MKRHLIILIAMLSLTIFLISMTTTIVYARLGGGSSSSSSGGGVTTSNSHVNSYRNSNSNSSGNPIVSIVSWIVFVIFAGLSGIILKIRITKAKIHSKQLMRILGNKEEAWKYKNVHKQVKKAYFILQKAWMEQEMNNAREYISENLYNNFQIKLEWMKIRRQKNILKKISLIDADPIAINDDEDNSKDYIWYYIKGSMIDYTINIDTKEIVEGSNAKTRFIEYWKFCRKDNSKWVLCEILQEDEREKIVFN